MSNLIRVDGLDGKAGRAVIIRRDLKTPGRIYFEGPKFASMTPDQAIAIANRIADVLDGTN